MLHWEKLKFIFLFYNISIYIINFFFLIFFFFNYNNFLKKKLKFIIIFFTITVLMGLPPLSLFLTKWNLFLWIFQNQWIQQNFIFVLLNIIIVYFYFSHLLLFFEINQFGFLIFFKRYICWFNLYFMSCIYIFFNIFNIFFWINFFFL